MILEPLEFELGGHVYKAASFDAMTQVHLVRRLAPILTTLKQAADGGGGIGAIEPAIKALGAMDDEAVDYIVQRCMARVQRKRPADTGWTGIWNAQAKRPMFEDIGGFEVLSITARVVMHNLGPFFEGLASSLSAAAQS